MLANVGVITGGITLNPIVLGTLTTAGILLKSDHEFKKKLTVRLIVLGTLTTAGILLKSYHEFKKKLTVRLIH